MTLGWPGRTGQCWVPPGTWRSSYKDGWVTGVKERFEARGAPSGGGTVGGDGGWGVAGGRAAGCSSLGRGQRGTGAGPSHQAGVGAKSTSPPGQGDGGEEEGLQRGSRGVLDWTPGPPGSLLLPVVPTVATHCQCEARLCGCQPPWGTGSSFVPLWRGSASQSPGDSRRAGVCLAAQGCHLLPGPERSGSGPARALCPSLLSAYPSPGVGQVRVWAQAPEGGSPRLSRYP